MEYATCSLNRSAYNYYGFYVTLQSRVTVGKGLKVSREGDELLLHNVQSNLAVKDVAHINCFINCNCHGSVFTILYLYNCSQCTMVC